MMSATETVSLQKTADGVFGKLPGGYLETEKTVEYGQGIRSAVPGTTNQECKRRVPGRELAGNDRFFLRQL